MFQLISTSRKKVIFKKLDSTSRNKRCKILFCLGEMVFFSINSILFPSGNHYWNYGEVNFYRKTSLPLIETVFQASEKWFLPFTRYSRQWKKFLPQMEAFFFMNSSFRLVKILFRVMLKILKFRGSNHFKRNLISACENLFLGQWKLIFQILLLVKGIFCLVETDF